MTVLELINALLHLPPDARVLSNCERYKEVQDVDVDTSTTLEDDIVYLHPC